MRHLICLVTAILLSAGHPANAQDWEMPHTFTGEEITGEALDANFAVIEEALAQLQADNAALMAQNYALQNFITQVLPYMDGGVDGQGNPAIFFSGVNVYVNNGAGQTRTVNGLGNLVIGYDEPEDPATTSAFCSDGQYDNPSHCINNGGIWADSQKTGSHNLVVGPEHSYTRYGGLVAGWKNRVTGIFATVSGGRKNNARAHYTSISGGGENIATASWAAVSGGQGNSATGFYASVSGGKQNEAHGPSASVSGGTGNQATFHSNSVSGGYGNTAGGQYASISGGRGNNVAGLGASVSGGYYNSAGGDYAAASAGRLNTADGDYAGVSGGYSNDADGYTSTVSGGYNHTATGSYDWRAGNLFEDY